MFLSDTADSTRTGGRTEQGLEAPELRVREAAAGVLLSAQAVVRDETLVFALLDGEGGSLSEERLNLLTYLSVSFVSLSCSGLHG